MKQLVDNLVEHLSMGKQEHLAFLDGIFYLLKQKDADVVDYQGLKAESVSPQCPKCESINIIKNGHQQGQQLYQCKECGKNFRVTTGTFVYNLHKKELMLDYILCMLEGKSLRQCAKEIGIDLTTSFEWRHRILTALRSFDDNVNFFGIMELEELLMKYSEKGRRYKSKEEYLIAQEKKQHNVAVLAMKDRSGNMLFNLICFDKVKKTQLEKILRNKVSTSSTICGEDRKEFKKFRSKNLKSKAVKRELVKDQNDTYNINTVRQHTVRFAKWIDKQFRGVATKYLQSYIMWYIVKHKYLLNKLIEDVGRMLNLAASDRRAWYEYIKLRTKPIENLT